MCIYIYIYEYIYEYMYEYMYIYEYIYKYMSFLMIRFLYCFLGKLWSTWSSEKAESIKKALGSGGFE
jgi:hypothetical protein